MNSQLPEISLVVALKNEEDNVQPLIQKVEEALIGLNYELILIDDGSTDKTVKKIKEVVTHKIKLIVFRKNFGQTQAMKAGIDLAQGKYIVTMDGDLQNDPLDIPMMYKLAVEEDWDMVAGRRKNRKDGFFLRKLPSKIANYFIRRSTKVYISDYGCSLKLFKSDIAKNLGLYGELHRFIPVLAALQGATITEVDVAHHARIAGKSKYGMGRTFKVISDLLLMIFFQKYAQKPMHLFGTAGFLSLMAGIGINIYMLVIKIMGEEIWGRPLLLLGILLVLGGIQLITIGIIADIQMRTYYESQDKKTYSIRTIITKDN
jgi:glycosyltransferase involved in cell wall biosynthesis